jgi:hypothetical protein
MARKKITTTLQGGFLALFGLAFFLPGIFLSGLYFATFATWWSAQRWVEVPCWIESVDLKVTHDDSTTYKTTATYHYIYQDRSYQGNRVAFSKGSDNIGGFQKRIHRELKQYTAPKPRGAERETTRPGSKPFRCYVNPAKPEEAVLFRDLRWEMQAFYAVFALTFPAVGAGVMLAGIASMRSQKARKQLAAAHPDAPWLWRPEWSAGPIPENSRLARLGLAAYTAWVTCIVVPLVAGTWLGGAFQREPISWVLLIFVALWCIPASISWKHFRQRMAIGAARLEMRRIPAVPGGTLSGEILLEKFSPQWMSGSVEILCERKTTVQSGSESSTATATLWAHQQPLAIDQMSREITGCRIPVQFVLPGDAPPCSLAESEEPGSEISWSLKLKVPAAGVNPSFSIPVFHDGTAPAMAAAAAAPLSIQSDAAAHLPAMLERYGVIIDLDERGLPRQLDCPPARNRGLLIFLLVFVLVWTGAAVFLINSNAPLIFKAVWPVSAVAIWWILIWQALHRLSVTFEADHLRVINQLGPFRWQRGYDRSQILGFSFDSNMTNNNQAFYRVRLESVIGKKQTVADGLADPATAEALCIRLESWRRPTRK